ncbi:MAG: orotidine-5'-phosphate decarboxylase [Spongiibacteraceae bacterium]|jgi:orotidine-5'-phosphate decarboxylase|nr:orotidine-5'-phosphate decarboxylase [Spongiibacteraceae bacterium]
MNKSPVVVALDYSSREQAEALAAQLDPARCRVKIGKELFTRSGPELVRSLQGAGFELFLDLKFHDIPNTVAAAVTAAAELGVWMVNVHATGGPAMMTAAREALRPFGADAPLLIAVTVLTSMDRSQLAATGIDAEPAEQVSRLARLAQECGLDGVVCSAQEAPQLRSERGSEFVLVTPGIRPASAAADDQQRIATPAAALANGSHYLVIGRPITRNENPAAALASIMSEIGVGNA